MEGAQKLPYGGGSKSKAPSEIQIHLLAISVATPLQLDDSHFGGAS
jgi:hypothetical protein